MIILKTAGRSLCRNLTRSVSTLLVIAAMAAFLVLYGQNMARSRREMEATSASIPVYADINALKGGEDPYIPADLLEAVEQTGFVKEALLKAQLQYSLTGGRPTAKHALCAVTGPDAERQLNKHLDHMTWAEGWDLDRVLSGTEPALILPVGDQKMPGDLVEITLLPSAKTDPATLSMTVAAVYRDDIDEEDWLNAYEGKTFAFCSVPWLRRQVDEGVFEKAYVYFRSVRLQLRDTVHINHFKTQMAERGFNSEETGLQMVIADRLLLSAINPLMKSLALQQKLFPLLFGLVALLGATLCWLTVNSRRQELAILRSLGATPCMVLLSFLSEALLLCLAGTALGSLLLLTGAGGFDLWLLPLFVLCYLAGGAVAIRMLDSGDVLTLLRNREQ